MLLNKRRKQELYRKLRILWQEFIGKIILTASFFWKYCLKGKILEYITLKSILNTGNLKDTYVT